MKRITLLLITIVLTSNLYSQIIFEKGYYINNSNEKIECLIKSIAKEDNPSNIVYKLNINKNENQISIKNIKEFSINNSLKYIRKKIKIDRSSSNVNNLSKQRNPIFTEEELFLKVLVEGESSLYYYKDGNLKRYFYVNKDQKTEQLIFKKFKTESNKIGVNNKYKQQLFSNLKCLSITKKKVEKLNYNKTDLINFFVFFNKCINSNYTSYIQKKDLINLTLRPRLNSSFLEIESPHTDSRDFTTENTLNIGFGIELEYILPFNKNKWSIIIEPTYQNFKSEKTIMAENVSGGQLTSIINYSSIEFPISLRHYFFLNKNSRIFANISYVVDFSSKSSLIEFKRADNSVLETLDIDTRNNFALGLGYKMKDKYSLELRYLMDRNIIGSYTSSTSSYNTFSVILGYTLF